MSKDQASACQTPINHQSYAYGAQKSVIREIAAYAAQRKQEIGADKVFDFSLGNPSVPSPLEVNESLAHSLTLPSKELHGYTPAAGLISVRETIAASLNKRFAQEFTNTTVPYIPAKAEDLYLTCGAAAAITISLHAVINPGDEVIIIAPYFPEYRVWIESAGATCIEVSSDSASFHIDTQAVAKACTKRTKAVIINSPNNPVGVVYPAANLEALAHVLRKRSQELAVPIMLIADEPYREISYGVAVPWVPAYYERTLVCYSYSKALSLPGERIGWVFVSPSHPEHNALVPAIAGAGRKLGYVCAPAIFQRLLADCIDVPADIESYAKNRAALTQGLAQAGYEFIEPEGAFYLWVRAPEDNAEAFCERAKKYELLAVPSDSFGCVGWFRIGYCVSYETIVNSLPSWQSLAAEYRQEL